MRRIQILLAVIAVVVAMMALAAPAMADMDISGGDIELDGSGGIVSGG